MRHHLAEYNIARLRYPLDHPNTEEFMRVLDHINALGEESPGFVWLLKGNDGASATSIQVYEDPLIIVNLSVWESPEHLKHYVYKSGHSSYFRRKAEWFEPSHQANLVCWWIPIGTTPSAADGAARLEHLRSFGQTDEAFGFTDLRPAP